MPEPGRPVTPSTSCQLLLISFAANAPGCRIVTSFKTIRARAEKRKGGVKALERLLPPRPDRKALAKLGDDRVLAEMTRRVFSAGFAWSVIKTKWPGFEQAFLGFEPRHRAVDVVAAFVGFHATLIYCPLAQATRSSREYHTRF